MGSIDVKSDETQPDHENASSERESSSSSSMVDSPITLEKHDIIELVSESTSGSDNDESKIFSCSSSISSTDSMIQNPLQEFDNENDEKSNTGVTSESPTIQTMERRNRIPSSVFARKKSMNTEWGMPSNESLFSINIGSMSFCNYDSMNWRAEDLDLGFSPEPSKSMEVGTIQKLDEMEKTRESDSSSKSDELDEESTSQKLSNAENDQERTSHFSTESESAKSFEFPILTGDTKSEEQLDTLHEEEEKEKQEPKAKTASSSWTNCFGCCTFCF